MRKLKVVLAIILIILMLTSGVYCVIYFTKKDVKAKVVTTIFPIYDICREIMGSSEDIILIQDNGMDMHSYEMSVNDIVSISNAELFLYIGKENDVDKILASNNNDKLNILKMMDCVTVLEESNENIVEGEHHDHSHDHEHHEGASLDEHIWLSVKNIIKMSESIKDKLIGVFPDKQDLINGNYKNYIEKLTVLEQDYSSLCENTDKKFVVTDRFPFLYLTHDYSMDYFAVFSGCSDETQASASTILDVVDYINTYNVDYVFVTETSNKEIANSVINNSSCREGVQILELNSCQFVPHEDLETVSLYDIMKNNLETLTKAL